MRTVLIAMLMDFAELPAVAWALAIAMAVQLYPVSAGAQPGVSLRQVQTVARAGGPDLQAAAAGGG